MSPLEGWFWLTVIFSAIPLGFGVLALISDTVEAVMRRVQS